MRENRKKKAVLLSALLAAAMVGTSALPVSAAEEDTASQVKPHVTEDVVTWEGGLLEIPVDLGGYTSDQLQMYMTLEDGNTVYYQPLDLSNDVATLSLTNYTELMDGMPDYTKSGEYRTEVRFTKQNAGGEISSDEFTLRVPLDSEPYSFTQEEIPFDGSEDLNFHFNKGTNYYELSSIDFITLRITVKASGVYWSEDDLYNGDGYTVDMEEGTVRIDKDAMMQLLRDSLSAQADMNNYGIQVVASVSTVGGEQFTNWIGSDYAWRLDVSDLDLSGSLQEPEQTTPSAEFAGINAPGFTVTTDSSDMLASDALSFVQENYADELAALGEDYTVSAELVLNEADAADVADETKTAFNGILDGKTIGQYYDISVQADVLKDGEVVEGLENIPVTDMKDKISISLKIPENLLNDGRTYSMLRYHNGQASVLDTTESEGTVTFSTDGFSTYALAYADAQGQGTLTGKPTVDKNNKDIQKTDTVTSSGTDVTVKKTSVSAEKAPKTGDQTEMLFPFAAVAAGMILTASAYGLRRKMK